MKSGKSKKPMKPLKRALIMTGSEFAGWLLVDLFITRAYEPAAYLLFLVAAFIVSFLLSSAIYHAETH